MFLDLPFAAVRRHVVRHGLLCAFVLLPVAFSLVIAFGDEQQNNQKSIPAGELSKEGPGKTEEGDAQGSNTTLPIQTPLSERTNNSHPSPKKVLRNLSDLELAAIARGQNLSSDLAEKFQLPDDQFNDLLLDELGRRWAKVAQKRNGFAEQPDATNVGQAEPSTEISRTSGRHAKHSNESEPEIETSTPAAHSSPLVVPGPAPATTESQAQTKKIQTELEESLPIFDEPLPIQIATISGDAFGGIPMGAGKIEVEFAAGRGPVLFPDTPLELRDAFNRTRYASFEIEYEPLEKNARQRHAAYKARRVVARCLLQGDEPINIQLMSPLQDWNAELELKVVSAMHPRNRCVRRWWTEFSKIPEDVDPEHRVLRETLVDCLARRHHLPSPWPVAGTHRTTAPKGLEGQFERAVEMLFGIESVKRAMQDDVTLRETRRPEQADRPLPTPRGMRSLNIPSFQPGWIEPIAMQVPEECFYLRTGTVANYGYFRGFLTGWGGNMNDVVSGGTLDRGTREKLEFQLCLPSERLNTPLIDRSINDMALIGLDPLFGDGAAVGVLFSAVDNQALLGEIKRHRSQWRESFAGVSEQRLSIANHNISFLNSDDNRVRSFYAVNGSYHLITNSEHLLRRFFQAGNGTRSLGRLREYQYSRSKLPQAKTPLAFLYLSDPFFRNLVGPHYRIEMTRRFRARRELQQFQLARLLARAEGSKAESIQDLVEANFLPPHFADRPDHSHPILTSGRYIDSLRGIPGAFLPVPDVPLSAATPTESSSYLAFINNYAREWRRVDPVAVLFSRQNKPTRHGLHQIGLDIFVTPYAQQRYATLARHLAEPTGHQLSTTKDDLLSVQAAVRLTNRSAPHLLTIGLQDDEVRFSIQDGQVRLEGEDPDASFAKTRAYAAINPPSTDVLRMLGSVLLQKTLPAPAAPKPAKKGFSVLPPPPIPFSSAVPQVGQAFFYFAWALGNLGPDAVQSIKSLRLIDTRDNLTVVSLNDQVRSNALSSIIEQRKPDEYRARLKMRSLDGAGVEPYIQAYTYLQARRRSADNARMIDDFSQWLDLKPETSKGTLERLLRGKLLCPIGGQYHLATDDGYERWISDQWKTGSRFENTTIPESWKFPFLNWLQELDLKFKLDAVTLQADANLLVRENETMKANTRLKPLKLDDQNPRFQVTLPAKPSSASSDARVDLQATTTQDWILGVRIPKGGPMIRVLDVYPQSPASRSGIRPNDIIESVNGRVPQNGDELRKMMAAVQVNGVVNVRVRRAGVQREHRITLRRRSMAAFSP